MSYSRNKYRCLLKPHNQNVLVSHDNNIQTNYRYPCYPGPYPGYPCIGPEPYINQQKPQNLEQTQTPEQDKPFPIPHVYPYGPYSGFYGPYSGFSSPYYGPYSGYYPGFYSNGPYPYSQKIKEKVKTKNVGNENVGNENVGNENVGNMKPHCEYYSSSSSSSDSDDYRRYRRRHAKVAPETNNLESNRVFDEQNQKPYPIPKPRPKPKNEDNGHNEEQITNSVTDKKSFTKPLVKLLTKFTTPEKESENEVIQVVEDEKKENNQKIYLKV